MAFEQRDICFPSSPFAFWRNATRGHIHGDRLRDISHVEAGDAYLRIVHRAVGSNDTYMGRVPRGDVVCDIDNERDGSAYKSVCEAEEVWSSKEEGKIMALQSTMRNMVAVLVGAGVVAALGLGLVNALTKKPIEQAKAEKVLSALREVLPEFDNDPSSEMQELPVDGGVLRLYPATLGGKKVGTAVQTFSPQGFGGAISLMVGFDDGGSIKGYSVLEQSETPGLGTRMVDWFKPQGTPVVSVVEKLFGFRMKQSPRQSSIYGLNPGLEPLRVSKDGGKIDAITSATISSRAFLDAVNRAYQGVSTMAGESTGSSPKPQSQESAAGSVSGSTGVEE